MSTTITQLHGSRAVTLSDLFPTPRKSVLLVDDSPAVRMVVKRHIERFGFLVDLAVSGQEAVEAARHKSYAVILMDCQMPEMDGYQAAIEIRNFEGESKHTPIIALTEGDTASERHRWFEAGMDDYMVKPATVHAILDALDQWGLKL